jgi:histidine ammonia-lyase
MTGPVYDRIRESVPFVEHDEYLKDYMDSVRALVDEIEIAKA